MILFYFIGISISVITLIIIYNFISAPRLNLKNKHEIQLPKISILIPARDEEKNIKKCLQKVYAQDYPDFEVIVLDDQSSDKTSSILVTLQRIYHRLRILKGTNLPENWTGKNWACYQLSEEAAGDYILFIDADVEIEPEALRAAIIKMKNHSLKLLSIFPSQIMKSFGEVLIVPLMNWILLSFLPLNLVYASKNPALSAANGQFMLWDKFTYLTIGGHQSVSNRIVEDMTLIKKIKLNGLKVMTLLGGGLISCRMYEDLPGSVSGFAKNFFPGFNTKPVIFLVMLFYLFLIFFAPFILVFFNPLYLYIIFLILTGRFIISLMSEQNLYFNILLHPVQMIFMCIVGINSVFATVSRKIMWKGRRI